MITLASRSTVLRLLGLCMAGWTSTSVAFDPDIIIDANDNPTAVELSATAPATAWTNETTVTNAFRGASKVCNVNSGSAFFRFHTYLPSDGPYRVFIWHNGGSSFYTYSASITHADAAPIARYYTQASESGTWISLGTYWFTATKEAEIKVTNSFQSGKLSADAVRFSPATADVIMDSTSSTSGVTFLPNSTAWTSVNDLSGYNGNIRRSNSTTAGASVAFQPTIPVEGDYDISIWLPPNTGAWLPSGSAPATISVDVYLRDGITVTPVTVTMPGTPANEGKWVRLGTSSFRLGTTAPAGKVVVKANGSASYYVPADAVRWSKVGAPGIVMDEDDGSPAVVLDPANSVWTTNSSQQSTNGTYYVFPFGPTYKGAFFASGSTTERGMTYKPAIPALGLYDVYLWFSLYNFNMPSYNNPATEMEIRTALGTTVSTSVNQQAGYGSWKHAGRYILNPGAAADPPWVRLSTPASTSNVGYVVADGVMFLRDNENKDTDGDGMPDWWEVRYFGSIAALPTADADGDGISNLQEYLNGTDPTDYYNGVRPTLEKLACDSQLGVAGTVLANPLVIRVSGASGYLSNAPVRIQVAISNALLSTSATGSNPGTILDLRTTPSGEVSAYVVLPSNANITASIQVNAGPVSDQASVSFSAATDGSSLQVYQYDAIGRLTLVTQPRRKTVIIGPDPNGNLLSITTTTP
jgi:hypothetical protein